LTGIYTNEHQAQLLQNGWAFILPGSQTAGCTGTGSQSHFEAFALATAKRSVVCKVPVKCTIEIKKTFFSGLKH